MALAETSRLLASLDLQDNFSKAIREAGKNLGAFDKKLTGTTAAIAKSRAVAVGIGVGLERLAERGVGTAVGFIEDSVRQASDLNEVVTKSQVVFGKSADAISAWAKRTDDAFSTAEALGGAATFGNLFTAMGLAQDKSADMSKTLVDLAGDLASFNNIDPTEVLEKLRSGLTGEIEPLRSLGVNLTDATLKAKAMELGLVKTSVSAVDLKAKQIALKDAQAKYTAAVKKHGKSSIEAQKAEVAVAKAQEKLNDLTKKAPQTLDPATKAQAAYALILEQTTAAQGDFARTSDGLANSQRQLRANFADASASLGTALLPAITRLVKKINEVVTKNMPAFQRFGETLGKAFEGIVDFLINTNWQPVISGLQSAAGFAKTLFDAFSAMPTEVKGILLALVGLNKLSGGIVGDIVSELGKGLIKGVLNMAAGVVNVFGKSVNGTPGGDKAPPGATGKPTGPAGEPAPAKGGAPRDLVKPGGGGGFDIAGALKVLGAGLALAVTVKGDTPQTVRPDAKFIAELERLRAAGRGNELVSATETVNQALGRLKTTVGDGDRAIAAIGRDQAAKVAAQKATTDRLLSSSQSQRGLLQSINAKDFSPDVRVSIPVTVNSNISIRDFSRASAQYQAVAKTTFRGQ